MVEHYRINLNRNRFGSALMQAKSIRARFFTIFLNDKRLENKSNLLYFLANTNLDTRAFVGSGLTTIYAKSAHSNFSISQAIALMCCRSIMEAEDAGLTGRFWPKP